MLATQLPELVKVTTATTGTGTVSLGAAASSFMGVGQLVNGAQYFYTLYDVNGTNTEVGLGTYTTSGSTLSRDTVIRSVISGTEGTTKLTLSGAGSTVLIGMSGVQAGSLYGLSYGSIQGLGPKWTSATVLGITPGSCYIESLYSAVFGAPADITPSAPAANTWYHIYAYSNAGVLTLEASTGVPVAFATPVGNAYSKTGDPSRRYMYSALTDNSNQFIRFSYHSNNALLMWIADHGSAALRVLSAGVAVTSTQVSAATAAPVTARAVVVVATLLANAGAVQFGPGDITVTTSFSAFGISSPGCSSATIPLDSTQKFTYIWGGTPVGGGAYVDITGYYLLRA
jgi:hypothetical protein